MTLATITLILVVLGLLLLFVLRRHEERKATDRRFEDRMKANLGPTTWPPPSKGPKGGDWRNRKPAA